MHANIVKVLGVCLKEKPLSLIVEYTDKVYYIYLLLDIHCYDTKKDII